MTHEPKIAALTALHERSLSPQGEARIERHLAACDACRRALAAMTLFERTTAAIRDAEAPELDWSRMELALAREARSLIDEQTITAKATAKHAERAMAEAAARETVKAAEAQRRTSVSPERRGNAGALGLVLAAAAALALVWAWPRGDEEVAGPSVPSVPSVPETSIPEPPPAVIAEVERAPLTAAVMLIAGRASARDDAQDERALDVGDELAEGATVIAAEGSELHLRIASNTGVVVRADSEAQLRAMREGDVGVELTRGGLVSVIDGATFGGASRFVVMAAEHRFEGRATHYEIELDDPTGVLRLRVADGEVTVHRPDGRVNIVSAPGSWSNEGLVARGVVEMPHGIGDDALAWPVLRVSHPGVVRWEIGDLEIDGTGQLGMRVGAGSVAIAGYDGAGRAFRTVADVGGDGMTIDASGLVSEAPRARTDGYLPQQDIQDVVQRGQLRLRQCYERGLRERPDLEARMRVQITVGLDGSVSRYRVVASDDLPESAVPDSMQSCVRNYVERWSFPPPRGGTVTFEAPLVFR